MARRSSCAAASHNESVAYRLGGTLCYKILGTAQGVFAFVKSCLGPQSVGIPEHAGRSLL